MIMGVLCTRVNKIPRKLITQLGYRNKKSSDLQAFVFVPIERHIDLHWRISNMKQADA